MIQLNKYNAPIFTDRNTEAQSQHDLEHQAYNRTGI